VKPGKVRQSLFFCLISLQEEIDETEETQMPVKNTSVIIDPDVYLMRTSASKIFSPRKLKG
jgi:hypothetical protein